MLRLKLHEPIQVPVAQLPRLLWVCSSGKSSLPLFYVVQETSDTIVTGREQEFFDYVVRKGGLYNVSLHPQGRRGMMEQDPVIRGRHRILSSLRDAEVAKSVSLQNQPKKMPQTDKEFLEYLRPLRTPKERWQAVVYYYGRLQTVW